MIRSLARPIPLIIALVLLASAGTTAATAESPDEESAVPGEVVVQLRGETTPKDAKRLANDAHGKVERLLSGGYMAVSVEPGREEAAIDSLSDEAEVAAAEPNEIRVPDRIPIDAYYPRQWNMPMIQAPQAWDITRGEGVAVAVLDTGVAFEDYGEFVRSPQLQQTDFIFPYDATNGTVHPNDRDGHGTHVTSTLAQDWDVFDVAGLVPLASIIPVRVCSDATCKTDAIASGIHWAVDHGADVINFSLSGPSPSDIERDAINYAEEHGVVVVAAAGNGGTDLIGDPQLRFPAGYENVISVGAVDRLMNRASYSNYGEHEGTGGVHVMAPGGNVHEDLDGDGFDDGILQTTFAFSCGDAPEDYKTFDLCSYYGTSMATPHVTGVAAMLLSEHPYLTAGEVRHVIGCSAKDLGPPGIDDEYGYGLVQAADALSDWDKNGVVDCLDDPPTFEVHVGDVKVLPGGSVRVTVEGSVPYPGLTSYEVALTYETVVADMTLCTPRREAICEKTGNRVFMSSTPSKPLWGHFQLANIDMQAVGNLNSLTSLQLQVVDAVSARTPDIGLIIVRDDGSLRITDPISRVYGDLDCDNEVAPADVIVALLHADDAALCTPLGDVNCDGEVNALDAIALLAYLGELARPSSVDCPPIGLSAGDPPPEPSRASCCAA